MTGRDPSAGSWRCAPDPEYGTCALTFVSMLVLPPAPSSYEQLQEIDTLLGLEATERCLAFEVMPYSVGAAGIFESPTWRFSSEGALKSRDLRHHLDWLLNRLEPRASKIASLQLLPGWRMSVSAVWWSAHNEGGPTLWPPQLARLAALNLELGLEVNFADEDRWQRVADMLNGRSGSKWE